MDRFSADLAFSRNLGWITPYEAKAIANKRIAIAGMGGVGGHYCEVMARLGVGKFRIADSDAFELVNFNRQNASGVSTLGKKKAQVLRERILDINPHAEVEMIDGYITHENMDTFLAGVDLYLDGLDFFALEIRHWLFKRMRELGVPAITVAPVGFGAAMLIFTQNSMSFENYFGIHPENSEELNALRFLAGLTPTLMQKNYQVDRSRVNFHERKVPSTPVGGYLCAGVAGSSALKLLLGRGDVAVAPNSLHFDAFLNSYRKKHVFFGYRNPLQKLKVYILRKIIQSGLTGVHATNH